MSHANHMNYPVQSHPGGRFLTTVPTEDAHLTLKLRVPCAYLQEGKLYAPCRIFLLSVSRNLGWGMGASLQAARLSTRSSKLDTSGNLCTLSAEAVLFFAF